MVWPEASAVGEEPTPPRSIAETLTVDRVATAKSPDSAFTEMSPFTAFTVALLSILASSWAPALAWSVVSSRVRPRATLRVSAVASVRLPLAKDVLTTLASVSGLLATLFSAASRTLPLRLESEPVTSTLTVGCALAVALAEPPAPRPPTLTALACVSARLATSEATSMSPVAVIWPDALAFTVGDAVALTVITVAPAPTPTATPLA